MIYQESASVPKILFEHLDLKNGSDFDLVAELRMDECEDFRIVPCVFEQIYEVLAVVYSDLLSALLDPSELG